MGTKILPPDDPHSETLLLMPWYLTGQIDDDEAVRIAAHLDNCAECNELLRAERDLQLTATAMPVTADVGWANMVSRLREEAIGAPAANVAPLRQPIARRRPDSWKKWFAVGIGAQVAFASVLMVTIFPARFVALGAADDPMKGNLIAIFAPDTTEAKMRELLRASSAQLVEGPTAANAYVLRVPADLRDTALKRLRAQKSVLLAEPIETDASQ
ncbi:MAG: zf-HC2 domain-containing protein [Sphingopyxis sp.]|nr:zf-HC2 domain-containing protein [Sphingopyxis sp.]